jgi:predicted DsbA family dithiol-disulfide isomerase
MFITVPSGDTVMQMPGPIVDVWADPICPFCYVALERADWLQERFGATLRWHPFDLHPEYPPEGIPRAELLARYGPAMEAAVRRMFEEAGLPAAELPPRVPNSRRAQRVAISAGERFGELYRRYSEAYFGRGRDIGDDDVIVEEAVAAGLAEESVRGVIGSDAHLDTLLSETRIAVESGGTGVPAWIVDGGVLIPGAQPHDVFERVLGRLQYQAA